MTTQEAYRIVIADLENKEADLLEQKPPDLRAIGQLAVMICALKRPLREMGDREGVSEQKRDSAENVRERVDSLWTKRELSVNRVATKIGCEIAVQQARTADAMERIAVALEKPPHVYTKEGM